ncbi:DUF3372 domain-containing protein [Oxalobacteraceae bacterium]|nr:DUF3372 domain-containing protein [Oxalobacteraceae bacterium]
MGATLGASLLLACGAASAAAPSLDACDGPFATVLSEPRSTPVSDARALWLNRQLIAWPGAEASTSSTFKLYHSASGQLQAAPGAKVSGADGALTLSTFNGSIPSAVATRFKYIGTGPTLALPSAALAASAALQPGALLRQQVLLVQEAADGSVIDATSLQLAGALDDLYASAATAPNLGATLARDGTEFKLWAPTARQVSVCTYDTGSSKASAIDTMQDDRRSGVWSAAKRTRLSGKYYNYLVEVFVPGTGMVRNLVTDPYSVSLTTDGKRSYIADLDAAALKPAGWERTPLPKKVAAQTDMTVYELHVRDFSINDKSVPAAHRGKYAAFGDKDSDGMRHLAALSRAGMTDIHLLPVFDIGSVPEKGCVSPTTKGAREGEEMQALVAATQATDCYNWGYDPVHYSAPEGSYASDPADGARRIVEFRQMVQALHQTGLRVGMDVVYNHSYVSGQDEKSILDRIVPGYYHRLNAAGVIERSTCCYNTATENTMMARLMIDSVALWAKHYKIDSFRFDLMGHQPRAAMEQLQARVNKENGRHINLIGEGWNFGEVANGVRFVQASQLSLNGSGIGTFSDRGRDAVRGGGAGDSGVNLIARQGYINGLVYDPNAQAGQRAPEELLRAADMVRVGLAGSLRSYRLPTWKGEQRALQDIDYAGQPAGYASEPGETVNYVENHDNQTLYDSNVFKLPLATSGAERAQVQTLGAAINTFSQGVAYFHAGQDILRSKSLDRNSFESGDWFNRLDWSYQDNYFGTGAPPFADNGKDYEIIKPLLANPTLKPAPADIAFARDAFRDLLAIRSSSTLFRLRSAADVRQRLRFHNTGPQQVPTMIVAHIDGAGYPGANFKSITYLINVDKQGQRLSIPAEKNRHYRLHPVHVTDGAADQRVKATARYEAASGSFTVPARSAVVFVE